MCFDLFSVVFLPWKSEMCEGAITGRSQCFKNPFSKKSYEGFLLVENCGCLILPFHYENLLSNIKGCFFSRTVRDERSMKREFRHLWLFSPSHQMSWQCGEEMRGASRQQLLRCFLTVLLGLFVGEDEEEERRKKRRASVCCFALVTSSDYTFCRVTLIEERRPQCEEDKWRLRWQKTVKNWEHNSLFWFSRNF